MTQKTSDSLNKLLAVMKQLRSEEGCPWDKQQTHQSLTPYAIEEAYELEEAIETGQIHNIISELGDLLFQVIFHCQIASEKKQFDFSDVANGIAEKMKERHPDVFQQKNANSTNASKFNWEKTKKEIQSSDLFFHMNERLPSLKTAEKIGKKAKALNFDWESPESVFKQVESEFEELKEVVHTNQLQDIEEELGDLLFSISQLARKLNLDAEKASRGANKKVIRRILASYKMSGKSWEDFIELPQNEKEDLWASVKIQEKKPSLK